MSLDAYYTAPDRACQLVGNLPALIGDVDLFIEPSAGGGAFLAPLPANTIALDLEPNAPGIMTADFLEWQPPEGFDRIAVVGNPPFGNVGDKARKFFNHAATFADYIAFIMPASFAKPSMQATLDLRFHLMHQQDLLNEPFTLEGMTYRFNTVFQVWEKRPQERVVTKGAITHADFAFVKSVEDADFAIRRVGALAGKIIDIPAVGTDRTGLSANSNYFLQATGKTIGEVRNIFSICDFSEIKAQAVAVPSIGKRDLIACYDRHCA